MDEDKDVAIIIGRPFLATIDLTIIDGVTRQLIMRVFNERGD